MLFGDSNSLKGLGIHLGIMLAITVALVIAFFYYYLPDTTKHGESIAVPNIVGKTVEEFEKDLKKANLTYEIKDSVYSTKFPPFAVIKQMPDSGAKVKGGRKITVIINSGKPDVVKMPMFVGASFNNAKLTAQNSGLLVLPFYVPSRYGNLVLKQIYKGREIEEGKPVSRGTTIVLEVGGLKTQKPFSMPNYLGQDIQTIKMIVKDQGLWMEVLKDTAANKPGIVSRQYPDFGSNKMIEFGDSIKIWVSK